MFHPLSWRSVLEEGDLHNSVKTLVENLPLPGSQTRVSSPWTNFTFLVNSDSLFSWVSSLSNRDLVQRLGFRTSWIPSVHQLLMVEYLSLEILYNLGNWLQRGPSSCQLSSQKYVLSPSETFHLKQLASIRWAVICSLFRSVMLLKMCDPLVSKIPSSYQNSSHARIVVPLFCSSRWLFHSTLSTTTSPTLLGSWALEVPSQVHPHL